MESRHEDNTQTTLFSGHKHRQHGKCTNIDVEANSANSCSERIHGGSVARAVTLHEPPLSPGPIVSPHNLRSITFVNPLRINHTRNHITEHDDIYLAWNYLSPQNRRWNNSFPVANINFNFHLRDSIFRQAPAAKLISSVHMTMGKREDLYRSATEGRSSHFLATKGKTHQRCCSGLCGRTDVRNETENPNGIRLPSMSLLSPSCKWPGI